MWQRTPANIPCGVVWTRGDRAYLSFRRPRRLLGWIDLPKGEVKVTRADFASDLTSYQQGTSIPQNWSPFLICPQLSSALLSQLEVFKHGRSTSQQPDPVSILDRRT